jgi:ABC-type transport system involved in cytochrome c biogenesis ATPase subunit
MRALITTRTYRRSARVDFAEQVLDFQRQIGIEIARRLICQNELWIVDEHAGDGNA